MPADGRPGAVIELVHRARGIVFDKDGTLVDLDARWVPFFRSFIDVIARECDDPALVFDLESALGVAAERLVADGPAAVEAEHQIKARARDVAVARGHSCSEAALAVSTAASQSSFGALAPLGDISGTMHALASTGRHIGVATSDSRRNTIADLTMLGVFDRVEVVLCGDDGGPVKPDPGVLLEIARRWGLGPDQLLFVGDSRQDLLTARAGGIAFVAVHDPRRGASLLDADASIATVEELVAGLSLEEP
jgi:phosphoglycolate phosphatase